MGDTGPVSQSPQCLELGMAMAKKYGNPILPQLTAAIDVLIREKGYKREESDYLGLLCYLPDIPANNGVTYTWPRSGELDFAKCYLQRNGTDRKNGLMYLVQGATYNHNHANGMSMELYGAGSVMGVDPGKGLTYEAPMHVNYYARWAAHNTVAAAAASSSAPIVTGGGGSKKIGHISLTAMEPYADKAAVSPYCSFTDTRYTDRSTHTQQQRTMAIIRTSDTSGYYIDIYRSDNATSNEYVYHNIGNTLQLFNSERKELPIAPAIFPLSKKPFDPPGFRMIQDYHSTGTTDKNVIALFSLKENNDNRFMQVLFTREKDRTFYTGKGPKSRTADTPYRYITTPTLVCRQQGEAWKQPFIAVYEPFSGSNHFTVESIENKDRSHPADFTALKVFNKDGSQQIVLQSLDEERLQKNKNWNFKGNFGVINLEKDRLKYLYLGSGQQLSWQQYTIESGSSDGAANMIVNGDELTISCNQQTTIRIAGSVAKTVTMQTSGETKNLHIIKSKEGIAFTIPSINNAVIKID